MLLNSVAVFHDYTTGTSFSFFFQLLEPPYAEDVHLN